MPRRTVKDITTDLIRDLHLPSPPYWMVAAVLILVVLTWVPLALIARARSTLSHRPRVHLVQDMDSQPKHKAQTISTIFRDDRAMRQPVSGTVARDELKADDHYYRGYKLEPDANGKPHPVYFQSLPSQIKVNEHLMTRGQTEFKVYCFPCHGVDGRGHGPVTQRAQILASIADSDTTWLTPADLVEKNKDGTLKYGRKALPDGELFNVISNGFGNMPPYGPQISVKDRWAIVAYVRALQVAQNGPEAKSASAKSGD